ncbi:MAG: hypothetical protein HZB21_04570 [Deltaproteobacteria bacterium]|nr:hypothetical protein [Deltaproteobacteria bacterium]
MKYLVKDTHIRHCDKTYGPGDVIELTEEEAAPIGHHLEPVANGEEPPDDNEEAEEGRKKRRR